MEASAREEGLLEALGRTMAELRAAAAAARRYSDPPPEALARCMGACMEVLRVSQLLLDSQDWRRCITGKTDPGPAIRDGLAEESRPVVWLEEVAERARALAEVWGASVPPFASPDREKEDATRATYRNEAERLESAARVLAAGLSMERWVKPRAMANVPRSGG